MKTHKKSNITLNIVRMSFVIIIILLLATGSNLGNPDVPSLLNYQGKLTDQNGQPITGTVSVTFAIYDTATGGNQLWSEAHDSVTVFNGLFNAILGGVTSIPDDVLNGDNRYFQLTVNGQAITPRQRIASVLFALKAQRTEKLSAADGEPADAVSVDNDGNVGIGTTSPNSKLEVTGTIHSTTGGIKFPDGTTQTTAASGGSGDGHSLDAADGNPTDAVYVDNDGNVGVGTTTPGAKLDISGDVNTSSRYKIGGNTVLSTPGVNTTLVGIGAGINTTGNNNTFLGKYAGYQNTTGHDNTFLGRYVGNSNTEGYDNTFSGADAGYSNTTGYANTFLGRYAGKSNTTGYVNTFLGGYAGENNATGSANTFLGMYAGRAATGSYNTFLGQSAGCYNSGNSNVFIGYQAGYEATGSNKLYIANGQDDANVLIYGDFSTGKIGIGTTSPNSRLEVAGTIHSTTGGIKFPDGTTQTTAASGGGGGGDGHSLDAADGSPVDAVYVDNDGEVGIGTTSPNSPLEVAGTIHSTTGGIKFPDGTTQTTAASGDGYSLDAADGSPVDAVYVDNDGKVGIGATSPAAKLHVADSDMPYILAGDNVLNTDGQQGFRIAPHPASGNVYLDTKTQAGGTLNLRIGQGMETGAERNWMTVMAANGNVGIGTTNPNSPLEVAGTIHSTTGGIKFPDGTTQTTAASGHSLDAADGNPTNAVYVDNDGNVGIGTANPGAKLDISGDVNTSSLYQIGGNTVLSTPGENTLVGIGAGINTTGYANTFLGKDAGYSNTTGYRNTFLGTYAGYANTEGSRNTFLGDAAGYSNTTGYGNVFIGSLAGFHETGSNKLYIANGQGDANVLIYGDFSTVRVGIGTVYVDYTLEVDGTAGKPGGGSWSDSSDERLKTNITEINGKEALEKFSRLRGVTFEWINPEEHSEGMRAGVIAQELEKVFPEWVEQIDPEGKDKALIPEGEKVKSISFPHDFNAYLIEAIKQLKSENEALKERVVKLEQNNIELESLKVRMAQIEAAIQSSGALAKEDDSVEVNNRIK